MRGVLALLVLALALPGRAAADEQAWKLLRGGGQVVLIRHTLTTPGVGDPPGMSLEDCKSQRNLTEEGRMHARRIGEAFRRRGIAVARVLSSPWCRCIETAQIAFGKAEIEPALGNLFGRSSLEESQVTEMKGLLRKAPGVVVWVTHGSTIRALTGISPETGGMVVLTPQGGGRFERSGRLTVE